MAVKEKLASSGLCKREAMRKTMSMPNFVQVLVITIPITMTMTTICR